jgi:hypothetical protein
MRRKIAVVIGSLALVIGIAGYAIAAGTAPKSAKACVNSHGVLSLIKNGRCAGKKRITLLAKGGPGTALGYAHITPAGTLDTSRSWNVAAGNAVSNSAGFWCFRGLRFTPHTAQLTTDYNGLLNGQIPAVELKLPADAGDCGLTSAQIEVFTGLVDPGVFTAGTNIGFYIVFY